VSGAGNAALTVARRRLAIRRQLATTPDRLRLASALLALSVIVFGAVAADAASTRRNAVRNVTATERLLVSAVDLSATLSDAHATAASSFLVGGPEPATSRVGYGKLLRTATAAAAGLASEIGSSPAVQRITQRLPVYTGLIESARANYRQGFPVGSAYLRRASETMRNGILLQGRELYRTEATNLTKGFRAGRRASTLSAVVLTGCAMLALLGATQVYITRATRRVVNPGLALATVLLVALMGWTVVAFARQQNVLTEAQRKGSDPIELLTATRILALRAQAEESIALAARGGGEGEPKLDDVDKGFAALTKPIGRSRPGPASGSGGLLELAAVMTADSTKARNAIDAIYRAYRTYLAAHRRVVERERIGSFSKAVDLAVGPMAHRTASATDHEPGRTCPAADGTATTSEAAAALNCLLVREVEAARGRFDDAASRAGSALDGLALGIPVLAVLCALLALFGVHRRLVEYR
jgi:hypothetical protein